MSYTIHLSTYSYAFSVVEQTVWWYSHGGDWDVSGNNYTLTIGGSGTSGTLRFKSSDTGEHFLVAVGVDSNKPWLDIVPDLTTVQTGVAVNQWYYNNGQRSQEMKSHKTDVAVTTKSGTRVEVKYESTQGQYLQGTIDIQ